MPSLSLAALAALVWGGVVAIIVGVAAVLPPPEMMSSGPMSERERFAVDLLAALGNDQPTADTVAFVVEWTIAEDGGDNALSRHNPLNTTMCGFNNTGAINGDGACGVSSYATYEDGLAATVATLAQPNFADLATALQQNDAVGAFQALIASPWAASHYNGGADWQRISISTDRKSRVTDSMIVNAGFYAAGAPAWGDGIHGGVDYGAPHGSPVYMPFDCLYQITGYYTDEDRRGQYLICYFADGYEYYSGHLEGVQMFGEGEVIPAGTLVGFTNESDHTHVQLRDPSGNLVDFEQYYQGH